MMGASAPRQRLRPADREGAGTPRPASLRSAKAHLRPNGGHSLSVSLWGLPLSMSREEARALGLLIQLVSEPVALPALRALQPGIRSLADVRYIAAVVAAFEEECRFEDRREKSGYGERMHTVAKLLEVEGA